MAASAMPGPPEADPVTPASVVTVTASFTRGLGIFWRAVRIIRNPGRAAMTAPKPYSEAVLTDARSEPEIADFDPSANFSRTRRDAKARTVRIPPISAPSTAQIDLTDDTSVMMGLAMPASWMLRNAAAWRTMRISNPLFREKTTRSGRRAIAGWGSFSSVLGSGVGETLGPLPRG